MDAEDKRELVQKFLSDDEILKFLHSHLFTKPDEPPKQVFPISAESRNGINTKETTDYNKALLDAVVAGTTIKPHARTRTETSNLKVISKTADVEVKKPKLETLMSVAELATQHGQTAGRETDYDSQFHSLVKPKGRSARVRPMSSRVNQVRFR